MHRRSKKTPLLATVIILSLWAISIGMIASGVVGDLKTLHLPA
ncbi:hypothetical protein SSCG_04131 [Streptomyces clavuligerus]|nr:hypothetical protein SSCG_04131 [Streptomyces clavuligerus]